MLVGIRREIKEGEGRVAMPPAGVLELINHGHRVLIEKDAGRGSGISDDEYRSVGAEIVKRNTVFNESEMILGVKEPVNEERDLLHEGQVLFTFLHLAADKELTKSLLNKKIIGVAYETVELANGTLPLLTPMSVIAGRLAAQVGAFYLQTIHGGKGILLGGVPGVAPGEVVILGAGNVGVNAAKIAIGMGARVTIMGIGEEAPRLSHISDIFGAGVDTLIMNTSSISLMAERADLLIGGILVKGARTPILVTRDMVKSMKLGSVIVDVSIDQGGCIETSHPTTHINPTYVVDDVIHYCVTNMPAVVAKTSTFALSNVTLPYALKIADEGIIKAAKSTEALAKGVNIFKGLLTSLPASKSLDIPCTPLDEVLTS